MLKTVKELIEELEKHDMDSFVMFNGQAGELTTPDPTRNLSPFELLVWNGKDFDRLQGNTYYVKL